PSSISSALPRSPPWPDRWSSRRPPEPRPAPRLRSRETREPSAAEPSATGGALRLKAPTRWLSMPSSDRNTDRDMDQIAVVGMAGRFPRAASLDDFWQNLCDGVASVAFYSDEELRDAGVHPAFLEDPSYVRAQSMLERFDHFDAKFFGFSPREAEIT